jgi:hypothetical protein
MANIIEELLNYLEVKHTKYFVNKLYNEHPHNRDMYGLKDMLSSYNIKSLGVDIKDKNETNMFFPSICHVNGGFVLALDCDNEKVSYLEEGKKKNLELSLFNNMWDGKSLVLTSIEQAREENYLYNLGLEWVNRLSTFCLVGIPFIIMLIMFLYHPVVSNIPALLGSVVGCFLCTILLQKRMNDKSIGDKFCSLISENGCDAVLSSNNSTIFYVYSWSEVGLAYFLAWIMILSFVPEFVLGLMLANYVAMAYGLWSIWYQASKVHKWCSLCISVQLVVWLLGIYYSVLLYSGLLVLSNIFLSSIVVSITILLTIVVIHFVVKSYLDNQVISSTVCRLRKFQVDNDVLKVKYLKESKCSDASDYSSVFWGDLNAMYQVTIISNPYCPHCRDYHKKIEPLLRKDNLHIGIRFIFISFGSQYDDACKLFIAAGKQLKKSDALDLYSAWFEMMPSRCDEFSQAKKFNIDSEDIAHEFELHEQWSKENDMNRTPVVLVNGYILPDIYEIEDINMMDEIQYHDIDDGVFMSWAP